MNERMRKRNTRKNFVIVFILFPIFIKTEFLYKFFFFFKEKKNKSSKCGRKYENVSFYVYEPKNNMLYVSSWDKQTETFRVSYTCMLKVWVKKKNHPGMCIIKKKKYTLAKLFLVLKRLLILFVAWSWEKNCVFLWKCIRRRI